MSDKKLVLNDWTGSRNKLSVIEGDTEVSFGMDLTVANTRVSMGVTLDASDLAQMRDMLNAVIERARIQAV